MHKYCKRLPWIAVAAQLRAEVASASDSFCKVMSVFSSQPGEPNQTRVWWTFRTNWAEEAAPAWNGVLIFGSNFIISLPCAWNLTKSEELKCSLLHCFQQAVISNSIKRTWKIWTIAIFFFIALKGLWKGDSFYIFLVNFVGIPGEKSTVTPHLHSVLFCKL